MMINSRRLVRHPFCRHLEGLIVERHLEFDLVSVALPLLYSAHDQDENDARAMAALCQSLRPPAARVK